MVQKLLRATMFAALGLIAVLVSVGAAATAAQKDKDKKDDVPSISDLMKKAHAKTDGYLDKIKGAAKGDKWEDAQKLSKDLSLAADALAKNSPKKGEKESWEKLTKKYSDNAQAVVDATDKKDAKATDKALGGITGSCGECHKAHKGK